MLVLASRTSASGVLLSYRLPSAPQAGRHGTDIEALELEPSGQGLQPSLHIAVDLPGLVHSLLGQYCLALS